MIPGRRTATEFKPLVDLLARVRARRLLETANGRDEAQCISNQAVKNEARAHRLAGPGRALEESDVSDPGV